MDAVRMLLVTALTLPLSGQVFGGIGFSPDDAVKMPPDRGIRKPSEPPLKASPDPGAVVVPPKVDPEAIETPPKNIDPGISKPPPATGKEKPGKSPHKRKPRRSRDAPPETVPAPAPR